MTGRRVRSRRRRRGACRIRAARSRSSRSATSRRRRNRPSARTRMQFELTEEQAAIRDMAREYADRVLITRATKRDETCEFPLAELKELGGMGLLAITVPEAYGGSEAGVMIVWAVTDPAAGHKGISAFIVPGNSKGLSVGRLEDKLGLRASSTAQLVFENVEVGDDAMLGVPGRGFMLAMIALDGGRFGISSQAIGIARGALEAAIRYAGERVTFGQPIIKHQAVGNLLADAATWLDAAYLMTLRAAHTKQSGRPFSQAAAMAKLFSTEHAWKICDIALQVHGGYGYVKDFPVERALRDVRVTRIYEGTSEIQRIVIACNLLRAQS